VQLSRGDFGGIRLALHIPRDDQVTIAELMGQSSEKFAVLLGAISAAQPRLRARDMAPDISKKSELTEEKAASYIGVLGSIQGLAKDLKQPLAKIIKEIHETLQQTALPNLPPVSQLEGFTSFATKALALQTPLGLSIKAYDLLTESERLFSRGRVISDVRPIFEQERPDQIIASVIVHTLKITYTKRGNPFSEDFYVEMDTKDIENLREALERSVKKEIAMTQKYESSTKFVVL